MDVKTKIWLATYEGPSEDEVQKAKEVIRRHEDALINQKRNALIECDSCHSKLRVGNLKRVEVFKYDRCDDRFRQVRVYCRCSTCKVPVVLHDNAAFLADCFASQSEEDET